MATATLTVQGIEELLQKLDPALLGPIVRDGLMEIASIAQPAIEQGAPRYTGRLAGSVVVTLDQAHPIPEYVAIGPSAPHTHLVELGAQPHFPPWSVTSRKGRRLRAWVARTVQPQAGIKGLGRKGNAEARKHAIDRATFLIARAISRRGMPGRFFISAAYNETYDQLEGVVDGMADDLEAAWDRVG